MPSNSRVHRLPVLVVALALGWFGCTIDDPQVSQVGAVSLITVDPANVSQSVILAQGGTITVESRGPWGIRWWHRDR